jgi:hypothetical protein
MIETSKCDDFVLDSSAKVVSMGSFVNFYHREPCIFAVDNYINIGLTRMIFWAYFLAGPFKVERQIVWSLRLIFHFRYKRVHVSWREKLQTDFFKGETADPGYGDTMRIRGYGGDTGIRWGYGDTVGIRGYGGIRWGYGGDTEGIRGYGRDTMGIRRIQCRYSENTVSTHIYYHHIQRVLCI